MNLRKLKAALEDFSDRELEQLEKAARQTIADRFISKAVRMQTEELDNFTRAHAAQKATMN